MGARNGVSSEWLERQEDKIARAHDARDDSLQCIRNLFMVMHGRAMIDDSAYRQLMSHASTIDSSLSDGIWALGTLVKYPPDFG